MKLIPALPVLLLFFLSCSLNSGKPEAAGTAVSGRQDVYKTAMKEDQKYPVTRSEKEWKARLGADRYHILREQGTEFPHSGKFNLHFEKGTYVCAGCQTALFESNAKFESNCGWPSFDKAIPGTIEYKKDTSHGMIRTEVVCAHCGGHLGHVFEDGPTDTGQRYCINSLAMDFEEE